MSKIAILLTFLFFCVPPTFADSLVARAPVSLQRNKPNALEILKGLPLSHSIDGFEVNCKRKTIIAWGKPKNLNSSKPQLSQITLIDMKKREVDRTLAISGGIFGVRYLKDGKSAYLESTPETLLIISTGLLSPLNENAFDNLNFEKCEEFPQKSYLKYAK
jgi:hypothetical protein